jgi:salicylate hydroxylase
MTLSDGSVINADIIIVADGVHSAGVEAILGKPNPPLPARHDNCCYRFLIPRQDLIDDPDTKPFVEGFYATGARLFTDPQDRSRRLVSYMVRGYVNSSPYSSGV